MYTQRITFKLHILFIYAILTIITLFPTSLSLPWNREQDYYTDEDLPHSVAVHLSKRPLKVNIPNNNNMELSDISALHKRSGRHHSSSTSDFSKSCCPVDVEIVEPIAGRNRAGELVELYQTDEVRQRFYETSCSPSVVDKPCKFLDKRHKEISQCVQQYSYTYALVRNVPSDECTGRGCKRGGWRLDYILVRSGCSCQISTDEEE